MNRRFKIVIFIISFISFVTLAIGIFISCRKTNQYIVSYSATDGGQILGQAIQTVNENDDTKKVIAVPDKGYVFVGWTDSKNKNPERIDLNVTTNIYAVAEFAKLTYAVQYLTDENGYIVGDSNQTIQYGESSISVTAQPKFGYRFVKWSDGLLSETRQDNVFSELKLIATFEFLFEDGDGTEEKPFLICNYEQLCNLIYYPQACYKLVQDIDMIHKSHRPIFDEKNAFNGHFDGNQLTIKNMNVDDYCGFPSLFGFIGGKGVVRNLNITNATIVVPNYDTINKPLCVGIVSGVSLGQLFNIYADGKIISNELSFGKVTIGGLVGQAQNDLINCRTNIIILVNNLKAQSDVLNIGGLVGVIEGNVSFCIAEGKINLVCNNVVGNEITNEITIGGLIGVVFVDDPYYSHLEIANCSCNVAINSDYDNKIGGFLGGTLVYNNPLFYIDISKSFSTGNINCAMGSAAGFINNCINSESSIFKKCYATGNVINCQGAATGFILRGRGLISNCYATGDVSSGSRASGFFDYFSGCVYRSFSTGNINSGELSAGFGNMGSGTVEECFSTGVVVSDCTASPSGKATGLVGVVSGLIKNCYSISDIIIKNSRDDVSITAVGLSITGELINCYYAGKIILEKGAGINSRLGALTWGMERKNIINCYWLCNEGSSITYPYSALRQTDGIITDVIKIDNIEDMYLPKFVSALNNGMSEGVWVYKEGCLPQLNFDGNILQICIDTTDIM